jgi:putative MATE family efflux protein
MTTAVFTQGSTLRHVSVMTFASAVGLVMLFFVDLVDMYFLSMLGEKQLAAAVGFSGALLFFLTAICIGLSISMGAQVSRALGQRNLAKAQQVCTHTLIFSFCLTSLITTPVWLFHTQILHLLGAKGETLILASEYTRIMLPSTPVLVCAMSMASALRAAGNARYSMYATLGGGLVNAAFDPVFIFGLGLGIQGAAWASVLSRFAVLSIAIYFVTRHYRLLKFESWPNKKEIKSIFSIAGPAMLTNLATPIGSSYVMMSMSQFGDNAVAGAAIIGRIVPVAFGVIFALSGAIGPIVGQNMGAEKFDRVRETLKNAVMFAAAYVLVIWIILFVSQNLIVHIFEMKGEAAHLIKTYCTFIAGGFFFNGVLFVANATFNNMGVAHYATFSNFARSLLGTIPFVWLFGKVWGAPGVLSGEIAGAAIFGSIALWFAFRRIQSLQGQVIPTDLEEPLDSSASQWAYCSDKSAMAQQNLEDLEELSR